MVYPVFSTSMCVFICSTLVASLKSKSRRLAYKHLVIDSSEKRQRHASFCDGEGWKGEWADEFSGATLGNHWTAISSHAADSGDHSAPVSGLGVTACRTARCRPQNVRLEDGKLILHSERDPGNASRFFTGAVSTRGLKSWSDDKPYRLCVSAKLPGGGQGVWPAHWMLPDNGLSERCLDEGEVDIMEMINSDGGAYSTYHYMTSWPNMTCGDFNKYHKSRNTLTRMNDFDSDFHEYAIERSKDHLAYAIDGRVVHHVPAKEMNIELSHSPFFLIMNTAIGGAWPGEPTSETKLPVDHAIDYVRVSRRSDGAEPLSFLSYPVGAAAEEINDVAHSASWADAWHPGSLLQEESHGPPPPISSL